MAELQHDINLNNLLITAMRDARREVLQSEGAFSRKDERPPALDEECTWDYKKVQCRWPAYCKYQYRFGDVTLDQSCRIIR